VLSYFMLIFLFCSWMANDQTLKCQTSNNWTENYKKLWITIQQITVLKEITEWQITEWKKNTKWQKLQYSKLLNNENYKTTNNYASKTVEQQTNKSLVRLGQARLYMFVLLTTTFQPLVIRHSVVFTIQ
jgi:hypothetical protein